MTIVFRFPKARNCHKSLISLLKSKRSQSQKMQAMNTWIHCIAISAHWCASIPALKTLPRSQELTTRYLQLFAAIWICFLIHRGSLIVFNRISRVSITGTFLKGNLWIAKEQKSSLSSVTNSRRLQGIGTRYNQSVFFWLKSPNEKSEIRHWPFHYSRFYLV